MKHRTIVLAVIGALTVSACNKDRAPSGPSDTNRGHSSAQVGTPPSANNNGGSGNNVPLPKPAPTPNAGNSNAGSNNSGNVTPLPAPKPAPAPSATEPKKPAPAPTPAPSDSNSKAPGNVTPLPTPKPAPAPSVSAPKTPAAPATKPAPSIGGGTGNNAGGVISKPEPKPAEPNPAPSASAPAPAPKSAPAKSAATGAKVPLPVQKPDATPNASASQSDKQLMESAIANTKYGNQIRFKSWGSRQGTYGQGAAYRSGGAIVMGSAMNYADISRTSNLYKNCMDGAFMKGGSCRWGELASYNHLFNVMTPWGVLFAGENNKNNNALANIRNYRVFVLYKGENTWREVHLSKGGASTGGHTPSGWAQTYADDLGTSLNEFNDEDRAFGVSAAEAAANAKRGYQILRLPNKFSPFSNVNHWGMMDPSVPANIDLSKVEGLFFRVDARLDPSNPTAELGMHVGLDMKHSGHRPPAGWFNGEGLTKIVKLTPQWQTIAWVNSDEGQDAKNGGRVLSRARLMNTTFPK